MPRSARVKLLFGPYEPPAVRLGQIVHCAIRGDLEVVGMSAGPIPWPIGRRPPKGRARSLIVTGGLVEAIRRESVGAIGHHWRVSTQTVWVWRKALGVQDSTEGTRRLRGDNFKGKQGRKARAAAQPTLTSPQRCAAISAALQGKPRPPEGAHKMGRTHLGKKHSEASRKKMSAAHKRRRAEGKLKTWRRWTDAEDELVRSLPPQEAAQRTGRPIQVIWGRRYVLLVNSARPAPHDEGRQ
jgi:hypothetical protein